MAFALWCMMFVLEVLSTSAQRSSGKNLKAFFPTKMFIFLMYAIHKIKDS